jgi:hypothetical protein
LVERTLGGSQTVRISPTSSAKLNDVVAGIWC